MTIEGCTTIQISRVTRETLVDIGKKGETYDEIIKKLLLKIDSVRGMVPRSRYIEKIILEVMAREAKSDG